MGQRIVKSESDAYSFVVCFDINGTILEGDSFNGDEMNEVLLTEPTQKLLQLLRFRGRSRVILYTFGRDYDIAVRLVEQQLGVTFPPTNFYFIARAAAGEECWAFPMHTSPSGQVSKYVDFSEKNPTIAATACAEVEAILDASRVQLGSVEQGRPEALRFGSALAFQAFVDATLSRGNAVFRACFDPQNAEFAGRMCRPGKVISSLVPVLVFDDNEGDWEVSSATKRIVHVLSPLAAARMNNPEETLPENLREQYDRERKHIPEGSFEATDMLADFEAFMQ